MGNNRKAPNKHLKQQRARQPSGADGEDAWTASQQSNASDGILSPDLANSIMEHFQAKKEKKAMEKQTKFIQTATKKLTADIAESLSDGQQALSTVDNIFAQFVIDYAAIEDEIRRIWCEIRKEQQTLLILAEKRINLNTETGEEVEKGMVTGMARAKGACEDMEALSQSLSTLPEMS
ncbi:hypothetical protein HGRIS_002452 [Hohenbuehelia grisea]|uniref:Uncharacterized protein n=1 Tax=Hohenbuehelia grisea TaxID=104357 RepID=A0ABR3JLF5_9AGAR